MYERIGGDHFAVNGDALEMHRSVTRHSGTVAKFLARHRWSVSSALQAGEQGLRDLGPFLMPRLADPRMIRSAWDQLAEGGGAAPGPNGNRFADFDDHEAWALARALASAIRDGRYRPGPDRRAAIPKGSNRGTRTITIQNIEDRAIGRALTLVIGPLFEGLFDPLSFGFRPGRNRHHALAHLLALASRDRQWYWVIDDVKDAFDVVPRGRLRQILSIRLPQDLVAFIELISDTGRRHGLRQGAPHSPLLMNVYLDHFLDRAWRRRFPQWPLLRTADDLIALTPDADSAMTAHAELSRMMIAAGMPLKGGAAAGVLDVKGGDAALWLGFQLQRQGERIAIGIGERAWGRLAEKLTLCHEKPDSPLRAIETVRGWLEQQGPCFAFEDQSSVLRRIHDVASKLAFDEIPDRSALRAMWRRSWDRWSELRQRVHVAVSSAAETLGLAINAVVKRGAPAMTVGPSATPATTFSSR